jgi:hypothetical protein
MHRNPPSNNLLHLCLFDEMYKNEGRVNSQFLLIFFLNMKQYSNKSISRTLSDIGQFITFRGFIT